MASSKPKPTPRQRAKRMAPEARREQILQVATRIFRTRHYGDVSLDEIAESAGIARGLINHHFGTKRDLYVEVVRRFMQVPEMPVPDYVHGATLRDRMDQSVGAWLATIERNRDLWSDSVRGAGLGDPEVARITEEAREVGAVRSAQIMGLGPVDELTPERLGMLRAWGALSEGAIIQWLEYGRLTREQVHHLVVESGARLAEGLMDEFAEAIGEGGR